MIADEFPTLLNARDEAGRVVYSDGKGGAYVLVPFGPEDFPRPPMPAGAFFLGTSKIVPRPASMLDPLFDAHPGAEIYINAARTQCRIVHSYGNPPPPPHVVAAPDGLRGK